jgi:hypothetical protein
MMHRYNTLLCARLNKYKVTIVTYYSARHSDFFFWALNNVVWRWVPTIRRIQRRHAVATAAGACRTVKAMPCCYSKLVHCTPYLIVYSRTRLAHEYNNINGIYLYSYNSYMYTMYIIPYLRVRSETKKKWLSKIEQCGRN